MLSQAVSANAGTLLASAFVLLPFSSAAAIDSRSSSGCQLLANAGLKVLLPTDSAYSDREGSYWSADAALGPSCIVQPRNSSETATALKLIADSGTTFAVRSGGHGQWAGSNDVKDGITIDMGLMTAVTYDSSTTLASIEPGPRWGDVFATLANYGVAVAGGRDADVGIGGFLTGGGNSYYSGKVGFGCDTVVNFEVALANGTVVQANKNTNSDLWKALKGGSGNFGIVTRFDVQAFAAGDLWGGLRASNKSESDKIISSLVNFTNANEDNPEDAYIINFTYNPSMFSEVVVASVIVDTAGTVNAPAFSEIQQIDTIINDVSTRSMANIAESYVLASGTYNIWFTQTFLNNPDIVSKIASLHDELVADLLEVLPADDFITQCLFQPMPTLIAQRGVAAGGNVLGMDAVTENALLWLVTAAVKTAEQEAIARPKIVAFNEAVQAYATSVGGSIDWVYLNYADSTQNPLKSYGAENVAFLEQVAAKYDPKGIFQSLSPSGWKLSKI